MTLADTIGLILQDALWAGIAATGFAILFNVPKRTLPACALGGALGHASRTLLMQFGIGIELATLFGSTLIGFLGVFFARRWNAPTTIFTVSAAIPLVPGVFAYRAMIAILQVADADPTQGGALLVEMTINAIKTGLILGAIAAGIAAPKLLFFRQKPVV